MKPYYQDEWVTIYNADCRDVLPTLDTIDLVLTDPPYNVGYHYAEYDDNLSEDDYYELLGDVIGVPSVLIHYPEEIFRFAFQIGHFPDKVVSWIYHANTPRQWRGIAWFGIKPDFSLDGQEYQNPNDKRIAKRIADGKSARIYDWWNFEQVKNVSAEKTEHPCQIPEVVMKRILRITPSAQVVLDPFMGSGTTLRAAKDLNRKAIGIEIEECYCEIAAKRMSQMVMAL